MRRFAWLLLVGLLIPAQADAQSYGSRFSAIAQRYNNTSTLVLVQAATTRPSATRTQAYNRAIVGLKSYGIWQRLDVVYLLAAADNQVARLNLKDPATFTALAVNSPTFTVDRGYTGDGSSSRLRTQYTPSTNGVNHILNDASAWVWSLTNSQLNGINDIGNVTAPRDAIQPRSEVDAMTGRINASSISSVANASSIGFFGATRAISTTQQLFKNGVSLLSSAITSTAQASQEQWICGANSITFSTHQLAAAAWGAALTGLEPQFYTILLSYMQSVGAS